MDWLSKIDEPMTLLTDYLICAVAIFFYVQLKKLNREEKGSQAQRLWSLSFLFVALSSFSGGTFHGFTFLFPEGLLHVLWKVTTYSIGGVSLLMSLAMIKSQVSSSRQGLWAKIFFVKFIIYLVWMTFHDPFLYVILDYVPSMLFVLLLSLLSYRRFKKRELLMISIGVLISFFAAGVQRSGFDPHPHFNHNDLYHMIQILGLYFFYKGSRKITDWR